MSSFLLRLALLGCIFNSFSLTADSAVVIPEVRQRESKGIGYEHGYTTLESMVFLPSSTIAPFVDLQGHHFDSGHWAANAGIGCRCACLESFILGTNLYYDYRSVKHGNFNQVGLGFELLNSCYSFRVNGYLPVGKKESLIKRCVFDHYIGDFVMIRNKHHRSFSSIDAEFEMALFEMNELKISAALGPYYLREESHHHHQYVGGQFRLSAYYGPFVYADLFVTTDAFFNTRVQGQLAVRIPLEMCSWDMIVDTCKALMTQPVRRHEIIPLGNYCSWRSNF